MKPAEDITEALSFIGAKAEQIKSQVIAAQEAAQNRRQGETPAERLGIVLDLLMITEDQLNALLAEIAEAERLALAEEKRQEEKRGPIPWPRKP